MDHRRLATLDLNLLVVLDALLTERSVGRAGKRVGLSQPAMSRALAKLRELLDDELLVRSGRQMLPTPRASQLGPALRRQLNGIAHLLEPPEAFDARRSERVFTIAATDYVERVVLVPLLASLRREAPSVRLVVRPAVEAEIARAETGDVDLGIAPLSIDAPGLLRRLLFRDGYVVAVRSDHPIVGRRRSIGAAQHAALPHVQVSPEGQGRSALDEALAKSGLARRIVYRTPTFAGALAAVAATDLAITLPSRAFAAFPEARGLVALALPFVPALEVHLIRHERFADDPGIRWLADRIVAANT